MENAVEALKIAFGVMIFVLALSMSISCFSQANSAVQAIVQMRDRETEYTYVKQTEGLTRIVGIESIVPTMYKSYIEAIEIYFYKENGDPLPLYKIKNNSGETIEVNYIGSINKNNVDKPLANMNKAIEHLDIILGVGTDNVDLNNNTHKEYADEFIYQNGIYEEFKNLKFKEELGEYIAGSGASEIEKRVITYTICTP